MVELAVKRFFGKEIRDSEVYISSVQLSNSNWLGYKKGKTGIVHYIDAILILNKLIFVKSDLNIEHIFLSDDVCRLIIATHIVFRAGRSQM